MTKSAIPHRTMPLRRHGVQGRAVRASGAISAAGPVDPGALTAAHGALSAGCDFLIARGGARPPGAGSPLAHRGIAARRAGNCLKELDRMLIVLIEAACGEAMRGPARDGAYARAGDAAQLLDGSALRGHFRHDTPRLRAIGRLRAMACGDMATHAASRPGADLALATWGHAANAPGAIMLGDRVLAAIAEFYQALADRLLREAQRHGAPPLATPDQA